MEENHSLYIGWGVFSRKLKCEHEIDRIKFVKHWDEHESRFIIADMNGKNIENWTLDEVKQRVLRLSNLVDILEDSDGCPKTFGAIMRSMLYDTVPEFTLNFPTYYKSIGSNPPDNWLDSDQADKMWSHLGDDKDRKKKMKRAIQFLEMVRYGLNW